MSRILIVEDDRKIAQLESDYLESNGYETKIIEDGKKALSELKTNHYDLILLDLMLPGCSGYDICRKIRDEIDIPILMVTARTEGVDVIRGLGLGADDYITKPFDPSQLVARVRSVSYTHLMGAEELEDSEFEPMFSDCEGKLGGKKIALFGSYGWGDGEWMRTWEETCKADGAVLACDSVLANEAPDDDAVAACQALGKALC